MHYSRNLQPLYSKKKFLNGSHGTIYTFKIYFVTVILAINFQFQQNKSYPNRPWTLYIYIYTQTHTDMHISFGSMGKGMGLRVGSLDNFLDMFYSNFPYR